jgi:hypothetical protein
LPLSGKTGKSWNVFGEETGTSLALFVQIHLITKHRCILDPAVSGHQFLEFILDALGRAYRSAAPLNLHLSGLAEGPMARPIAIIMF